MNLLMVLFAVDFGDIVQVLILAVVAVLWFDQPPEKTCGGSATWPESSHITAVSCAPIWAVGRN